MHDGWNGMGWASDLVALDWMEGGHGLDGTGDAGHKMDTENARTHGWMGHKACSVRTKEYSSRWCLIGREGILYDWGVIRR
jgi:hypothetical protein